VGDDRLANDLESLLAFLGSAEAQNRYLLAWTA
jgi:hypothetical protein